MSEAVIPQNGPDSNPSQRDQEQHWVKKSIEEIADDYFSSVNPIAKKIILEKKKYQQQNNEWDRLNQYEKDTHLNDWFIDASIKLRYELKLGIIEAEPVSNNFPRLMVQGGTKMVQYRDELEEGSTSNSKAKILTWKDEFSGPFSWETKCQQELSINGESSSPGTPRQEATTPESLLLSVDSPKVNEDSSLFPSPKGEEDQPVNSVMIMKDVTKRHSFGSNLLASLEERLAFDQAVVDAVDGKDNKEYQHIGHVGTKYVHAGETESSSGGSTPHESRRKTSEHSYKSANREKFKPSKPKMAPPGPGPKPRDIPKYTDPPRYHKSEPSKHSDKSKSVTDQVELPSQMIEPPSQIIEPSSQMIDRGRPTVEPPKQPKASKPKMEPPKPKSAPHTPKTEPPKLKTGFSRPSTKPPQQPANKTTSPSMEPPESVKPKCEKIPGVLSSPKRRASVKKDMDKEQLLPSPVMNEISKELTQSHDNISMEEEKSVNETITVEPTSGAGDFDFLTGW